MFSKIPLAGVSNAEWLRLRKSGIGGSDAGAICGVNPYSSAMKIFRDKTSEEVEEQDSEAIRIGHDLEEYVAQRFTEATGLRVRRSNYMYRSVENPFMIADVDRVVIGEDAGLECKTASAYNADKWADGNIPLHYIMQCYHYMVSWKNIDATKLDTKRIKEERPELYADYGKVSHSRRFEVKAA